MPPRCPRCRGEIIVDRRPGAFEPYCLPCGWCWFSPLQVRLARLRYHRDRLSRARPMDAATVDRVLANRARFHGGARRTTAQSA